MKQFGEKKMTQLMNKDEQTKNNNKRNNRIHLHLNNSFTHYQTVATIPAGAVGSTFSLILGIVAAIPSEVTTNPAALERLAEPSPAG